MLWHSWAKRLGIGRFLLVSIVTCFALSLLLTLESYNVIYEEQNIVDAAFVHRGWPLHWAIESWSYWSPPPYPHHVTFQLLNFFIDFVFYAIMFQVPMQAYVYSKEARKKQALTAKSDF
jgi:hypothetical protein